MGINFDDIYREHADQVYAFIKSMLRESADADDCFQQTCLSIYKSLADYQETGRLRAWVFQIARRAVYDFMRRKREWQSFDGEEEALYSNNDPVEELQAAELQEHLESAICSSLNPPGNAQGRDFHHHV